MSADKQETPQAPKPVNSEVYSDGFLTGKTTLKKGTQKQESFSTPYQQQQTAFNQSQMLIIEQRLFNPDQTQQDSWQSIATAKKENTMKAFNEDFQKKQDALLQSLSSRGMMNSSQVPYMTNELGKTAANQLNTIENQYIADQQNAQDQEYNRNIGLYNLLNGGITEQLNTNNSNLNNALQGFNTGNEWERQDFVNNLALYKLQQEQAKQNAARNGNIGSLVGTAASIGLAPFTGGASLALMPAISGIGSKIGGAL